MTQVIPTPPVALVRPRRHITHGDVRIDNYYWLRERDAEEVIDYLDAENEYVETVMAGTEDLQQTLYDEMRSRIKESDQSVPIQIDNFFYYQRTEEGLQYPIYCRREGSMDAPEQILLDVNRLAEGEAYMRLGNFAVSPDHRLLAYAVDVNGSERYELHFEDLSPGQAPAGSERSLDVSGDMEVIPDTYYGLAWANDSRTVFYTTVDQAMRPYKLWRHQLGQDPADDELVFHETDESYFLSVRKSKSKRYVFIQLGSKITDEVHFLDANDPAKPPQVIQPRVHGTEYSVAHHQDGQGNERFFIRTNWDATNFRVMETPVDAAQRENWQEVVPHRDTVTVDGLECFHEHLVLYERENALRHIRVHALNRDEEHRIEFDVTYQHPERSQARGKSTGKPADLVYTVGRESNPNFDSSILRYSYTSLVRPQTVYDYDMLERTQLLRKEEPVPGYDPAQYTSRRLWATAEDGTRIPMSLVARTDVDLTSDNPLLLYGYGSYGASIDPHFRSNIVSLLDRGFVFVIAHIRGGGEMGREWYEKGKYLYKKNTFTDFIACSEHLIGEGYTSPDELVIMGRSAGGLLMGAVTNMRPDLYAGVVAGVPFVDVINTMLDPTIPLTVIEYEEWGNPNDPEYYEYIKSYSPYDNLEAKAYPMILATAGLNDPRVQYWEPAKWVARLRAIKTDENLLLLKTNMGAGHAGASGRFDYLKETAFEYAFVLKVVGREG